MIFRIVLAVSLFAFGFPTEAKLPIRKMAYPALVPAVANMGPGCRVRLDIPLNSEFGVSYAEPDKANALATRHQQFGGGGFGVASRWLPFDRGCASCLWHVGFTCYHKDSDIAQGDIVMRDSGSGDWVVRPERSDLLPSAFPEYRLTVYQIKSINAEGWAITTDVTATNHPQRLLDFCIYKGNRAICGNSNVADLEVSRRYPLADRTQYVLKILRSINFLDDVSPGQVPAH